MQGKFHQVQITFKKTFVGRYGLYQGIVLFTFISRALLYACWSHELTMIGQNKK